MECSLVPMRYRSSPSILYIMASISVWLMWSPRQKKYAFEVGSCTNMGDAQARRLKLRVKGEDGKNYLPHTLNNTVVAPPRMSFSEVLPRHSRA